MTEPTNGNGSAQVADPVEKAREYFRGFPEAPYSDSFKWVDQHGFEHLSTVRGWSFTSMHSSIGKATEFIAEHGGVPAGSYRQIVPAAPAEPTRQPIDDSGAELPPVSSFVADRLSYSVNDGKDSFRVMGGQFEKWGVAVYPEILKECGVNVAPGQPVPDIRGWRVDWIEAVNKNTGKAYKKVVRLLPPK